MTKSLRQCSPNRTPEDGRPRHIGVQAGMGPALETTGYPGTCLHHRTSDKVAQSKTGGGLPGGAPGGGCGCTQ